MERDNKYDPQDLEQLMEEKSFVQLLDDERAFVLKHMSGEAEYEQVREVMFAIQENISKDETIAPKPELRRELIATFKEEQKKGYRYWLNSIGALFLPKEGQSNWTPALRLASILILLGGLWFTLEKINPGDHELAELVETEQIQEPNENILTDTKEKEESAAAEPIEKEGLANNNYAAPEPSVPEDDAALSNLRFEDFKEVVSLEDVAVIDEDLALEEEFITENEPIEAKRAIRADAEAMPAQPAIATADKLSNTEESVSREVQSKDYFTGVTANALYDGDVELAVHKERSKSRNLAQDASLVSLLVQAY